MTDLINPIWWISGLVWLLTGIAAAGLINAADRGRLANSDRSAFAARQELAFLMLWVPGGIAYLIVALIISGLGYYGWTLSAKGWDRHHPNRP